MTASTVNGHDETVEFTKNAKVWIPHEEEGWLSGIYYSKFY